MSVVAPPLSLSAVSFSFGSDAQRVRQAAVEINSGALAMSKQGAGRGNDLSSLYLGTVDGTCATCLLGPRGDHACPGHEGVMRLRAPLQHPLTIPDVVSWLRVACLSCKRSLIPPDVLNEIGRLPRGQRLRRARDNAATNPGKACPHCGAIQPKIEKAPDDHVSLQIEVLGADAGAKPKGPRSGARSAARRPPASRRFMPGEIRGVLEALEPALVEVLSPDPRQHPKNLLVACPTVPTVQVRPKVRIPSLPTADAYDAPTTYFARIAQANHEVSGDGSAGGLDPKDEDRLLGMNDLYFAVLKGATGTAPTARKRTVVTTSGQPNTSLLARQKRKFGRIRRDCLGSRVWLLSRDTISGNPDLTPDEVGVPLRFARMFRVEEPVTPENLERLTAIFLRREPGTYPRCHGVYRRETGRYHAADRLPESVFLEIGDRVVREAVNGDIAIFSRPPALERSSITAHKIVVLLDPTQTTFQMNVIVCSLYNADFNRRSPTGGHLQG